MEDVDFTCICGDISQNGTEEEFAIYKQNVDSCSPTTPVYTTVGNHDARSAGLNESLWNVYTGHNRCFEFEKNNDVFIFFGMNYWSFGSSGNPYLDADIEWLSERLNSYRNRRTFIFTHPFFHEYSGNLKEIYPSGNWLMGEQYTKLKGLVDHYKNTIWFSGHSHWMWYLQKYQDNANVQRSSTGGWTVHVPSCASPINSDGISTRVSEPLKSEGAVVDVFENAIVIKGRNLKDGVYLPIAQYTLDTTLVLVDMIEISLDWVVGGISSTTGADKEWEIYTNNALRTDNYIPVDSSQGYYLTIIPPILTDATGVKDLSIAVYDADKVYLGRANGLESGSYYFNQELDMYEITSNIFDVYPNAAFIRIKFYKNSTTDPIVLEEFNTRVKLYEGKKGGDSSLPDDGDDIVGIETTWEQGGINNNTGADMTDSKYFRTEYISIDVSKEYEAIAPSTYATGTYVFYYGENKTFISKSDAIRSDFVKLIIPTGTKFVRLCFYDPTSVFTIETAHNAFYIKEKQVVNVTEYELKTSDFTVRSGSPTITETTDGYFEITFPAKGNKFYVHADGLSGANTATFYADEVIYPDGFLEADKTAVGFYTVDSSYTLEPDVLINLKYKAENKMEFNLSSSQYTGFVPLTLKIKGAKIIMS